MVVKTELFNVKASIVEYLETGAADMGTAISTVGGVVLQWELTHSHY